jgi:pimeloyl-ACP methyl ester carboxylesterase
MAETISHGIPIAYEDVGRNEPVLLLLPAWCQSRSIFMHLGPLLAASHRVVALDWRGHGQSGTPAADFGARDLVDDALAVIAATKLDSIVPVSVSHAGWVSIELRRRLGERVHKLVFLDWLVGDPPPMFLDVLTGLQQPGTWRQKRLDLFTMWRAGSDNPEVIDHIQNDMGAFESEMWARAGREIAAAYAAHGSPLRALAALDPPPPALHLYAQPKDDAHLAAQQSFARAHPWFRVHRVDEAQTHFPALEVPGTVANAVHDFVDEV